MENLLPSVLSNHEKSLVQRLLIDERFRVLQHARDVLAKEGIDMTKMAQADAKMINEIILKLQLPIRTYRDPAIRGNQTRDELIEEREELLNSVAHFETWAQECPLDWDRNGFEKVKDRLAQVDDELEATK